MLNRAHALLDCEVQVRGAHVVLEIDERLGATVGADMARRVKWAARRQRSVSDGVVARLRRSEAGRGRRRAPRRVAFRERAGKIESRVAGPGRPLSLHGRARFEDLQRLIEGELAARLREEMHRRRPAARHHERIAGDRSHSGGEIHANGLDPETPVNAEDLGPGRNLDAGRARRLRQRPRRLAAQIRDQLDGDARAFEIEGGAIGAVVRGSDDGAFADLDAILAAIAPRGVREHHARPVVIREDQGTLDGAGRQHDLARAHLPEPLARAIVIGDEVCFRDALVEGDEILRVIAERLRSRHQAHVGRGKQRSESVMKPISRASALDLRARLGEE